jgi:hypothetical protein
MLSKKVQCINVCILRMCINVCNHMYMHALAPYVFVLPKGISCLFAYTHRLTTLPNTHTHTHTHTYKCMCRMSVDLLRKLVPAIFEKNPPPNLPPKEDRCVNMCVCVSVFYVCEHACQFYCQKRKKKACCRVCFFLCVNVCLHWFFVRVSIGLFKYTCMCVCMYACMYVFCMCVMCFGFLSTVHSCMYTYCMCVMCFPKNMTRCLRV